MQPILLQIQGMKRGTIETRNHFHNVEAGAKDKQDGITIFSGDPNAGNGE